MTKAKLFFPMILALLLTACATAPRDPLPGIEHKPADEDATVDAIEDLFTQRLHDVHGDEPFLRDTHPKSNGCVRANFRVDPDIPERFRQGVFATPRSYPAWMRFSNAVPMITHDEEKDFRGLAIKLFGVEGERVQPSPDDEQHTQDFLFIAFAGFFAEHPKDFLTFFTNNFERGRVGRVAYFLPRPRAVRNSLIGRKQFANPLDIDWFGVAPFAHGHQRADGSRLTVKYKVDSCSDVRDEIPKDPDPDYLQRAMQDRLDNLESDTDYECLAFWVQEQTEPLKMPIEDTLKIWKEKKWPFIKIATITVPKQNTYAPGQVEFCENLSYNPWHSLEAHRPLGGINRSRLDVMKTISDVRLDQRGVERVEPTGHEIFE